MSTILTHTGRRFTPLRARKEDIAIADIAHALSLLCRANGHFPRFFSVAQHSVNCAAEAACRGYSTRVRLACLLHDASEAYISDVTRPVKAALPEYRRIEAHLQHLIYELFLPSPLTDGEHQLVEDVDDAMLYSEFMHFKSEAMVLPPPRVKSEPRFAFEGFEQAEKDFLDAFEELHG